MKRSSRTLTISTKVTAEEKLSLLRDAEKAGQCANEYYRDVLLAEHAKPDALKLLAAEVRAMRSILFQLVTAALAHQPLTDQQIQRIVAVADETKYDRGEESLLQLAQAKERGAA